MSRAALRFVKKELILFITVIFLALTVFGYSYYLIDSKTNQQHALNNYLLQVDDELTETEHALDTRKEFETEYKNLLALGFLSEEQRLLWVERLETTARQLNLSGLRYTVRPQKMVHPVGNGLSLNQSQMTFEIDLLHEGDLITLLNQLRQPPAGLMIDDQCTVSKTVDSNASAISNIFQGRCQLSWYTVSATQKSEQTDLILQEEMP